MKTNLKLYLQFLMASFRWYILEYLFIWQLWFIIYIFWFHERFDNIFYGSPDSYLSFLCYRLLVTVLSAVVLLSKETVKILQIPLRRIMGGNPRYPKYILGHELTSRLLKLLESSGGQHTQGSQWLFFQAGIILVSILKQWVISTEMTSAWNFWMEKMWVKLFCFKEKIRLKRFKLLNFLCVHFVLYVHFQW